MNFFIHQTPKVLTDELFTNYGGHVANSTTAQRQAAFVLAEVKVQEDLETFLYPQIVTGTYLYQRHEQQLDHTYIRRLILTRFRAFDEDIEYTVSGTGNWYQALRNDVYGLVNFGYICDCCCPAMYTPYHVDLVYEAGIPSGTIYTPPVLLALTTYADLALNEIIGYGNEAPGDIGVQSFSNQDYSETRVKLSDTVYGSSPRAAFAHKQLKSLRVYRHVGLGKPVR